MSKNTEKKKATYQNRKNLRFVETGKGNAKRYSYNLGELIFLDENLNQLFSIENIEVYLAPPNSKIESNVIGMNVIKELKKMEIDSEKITIFW